MDRRKDSRHKVRRTDDRRQQERRAQAAPVFMDTRAPGDRRAGPRRTAEAPDEPVA